MEIQKEEIETRLADVKYPIEVLVLNDTDSTNRVGKEMARAGGKEGMLIVALSQSGGRGRLGRTFFSPEGGIYMSLLLRPSLPMEQFLRITTAAAVSVAQAIEKVTGKETGIKWVNDIFMNGKKVCGILCEAGTGAESGKTEYAVLGIGINVRKQAVPEELKDIVGCLEDFSEKVDSNLLIAEVWKAFFEMYENLSENSYMEEYRRRSILIGQTVTVPDGEGAYTAQVTDIDEEGRLVVNAGGELRRIGAGEVSVRLTGSDGSRNTLE